MVGGWFPNITKKEKKKSKLSNITLEPFELRFRTLKSFVLILIILDEFVPLNYLINRIAVFLLLTSHPIVYVFYNLNIKVYFSCMFRFIHMNDT